MIRAIDAAYAIGKTWIVRGLSAELRPGRVISVVGPNGAGKTTALRLLAGLLPVAEGQVQVDGRLIESFDRRELARTVTYVPQKPPAAAGFTVRECVAMGRYCHRGRFESESADDRQAIREALEVMDCSHLSQRTLNELSGGELQRVVLARSVATSAPYLLLDEPTANLDIEHSLAILDHVRAMASAGRCVLIALHDLNTVIRTTDFVYVLQNGRIKRSGTPLEALSPETVCEVFSVHAELMTSQRGEAFRFERIPPTPE